MIPYFVLVIESDADRRFMTMLYQKYNRLIYHEIFQIVSDTWVAEDLMQEVFIKLIERLEELRCKDRNHLVNYVISAAKNSARNYLRDSNRYVELPFDEQSDLADPTFNRDKIEMRLVLESDLDRLTRIWPRLDGRSRYLLDAYYILKKSTPEMALDLGVKSSSVRMALTRARRAAYQLLEQELEKNTDKHSVR